MRLLGRHVLGQVVAFRVACIPELPATRAALCRTPRLGPLRHTHPDHTPVKSAPVIDWGGSRRRTVGANSSARPTASVARGQPVAQLGGQAVRARPGQGDQTDPTQSGDSVPPRFPIEDRWSVVAAL